MATAKEKKTYDFDKVFQFKAPVEKTIKLTFTQEVLGTVPGNAQIYKDYIASKFDPKNHDQLDAEDRSGMPQDELDALPEIVKRASQEGVEETAEIKLAKSTTWFLRSPDGRTPGVFNYWIKGGLKAGVGALLTSDLTNEQREALKSIGLTWWTFKNRIANQVIVKPRFSPFVLPAGVDPDRENRFWERPAKVDTQQGVRTSLLRSEIVPIDTTLQYKLRFYNIVYWPIIKWVLDRSADYGLGQWCNSGAGTFTWELIEG
jgi:hypothetical protein